MALNTIKQTNEHKKRRNLRFIKRHFIKYYIRKILSDRNPFWHTCNYLHVDFDWPRKKTTLNSSYNVQFSISWQYLASKLWKVQELQSGKSIYRQILMGYSISWNSLYSWKILRCEINVHEKTIYKNQKQMKKSTQHSYIWIFTIYLLHTEDPFG